MSRRPPSRFQSRIALQTEGDFSYKVCHFLVGNHDRVQSRVTAPVGRKRSRFEQCAKDIFAAVVGSGGGFALCLQFAEMLRPQIGADRDGRPVAGERLRKAPLLGKEAIRAGGVSEFPAVAVVDLVVRGQWHHELGQRRGRLPRLDRKGGTKTRPVAEALEIEGPGRFLLRVVRERHPDWREPVERQQFENAFHVHDELRLPVLVLLKFVASELLLAERRHWQRRKENGGENCREARVVRELVHTAYAVVAGSFSFKLFGSGASCTGTSFRISRTRPLLLWPSMRAAYSSTMRWLMTGTASTFTSSKLPFVRP